jgi:chemotaxis signal transduction protein
VAGEHDAPADLALVAERIARAIAEAEATPPERRARIIVFRVGALVLALPLAAVREVVLPARLSRVPRAPEAVLGIMNLRGRVVAVVDLLHALPAEWWAEAHGEAPPEPPGAALEGGRILLLDRGRREVGLLVREVVGIAPAPEHPTSDHPPLLDPERLAGAIAALVA